MGRLTIRTENGAALKLDNPQNETEARKQLHDKYLIAIEKLAHYEDLEEQGLLAVRKQGRWIPNKQMIRTPTAENYHCSECTQTGKTTVYCPNCGAKMVAEAKLQEQEVENEQELDR